MSRFFSGDISPREMTRDMGDISPIYVTMFSTTEMTINNMSMNTPTKAIHWQ